MEFEMSMKMLVGVGLGLLALLWVLGRIKSSESESSAAAVAAQSASLGKWKVSESKSPMDDSKTVVLSLDADNNIHGPLGDKRPTLIIRCQEKKTKVYVVTGMAASVEEGYDGGPSHEHKVGLRFDSNAARYEFWNESTADDALFADTEAYGMRTKIEFPAGPLVLLAKELAKAKTLTFQFTPFNGNPQVATFDLRGSETHIGRVAEACGWAMG
jgi:type VI secretion system protein VasI